MSQDNAKQIIERAEQSQSDSQVGVSVYNPRADQIRLDADRGNQLSGDDSNNDRMPRAERGHDPSKVVRGL